MDIKINKIRGFKLAEERQVAGSCEHGMNILVPLHALNSLIAEQLLASQE